MADFQKEICHLPCFIIVILMLAAAFCVRIPKNLIIKLLVLSNQLPRKRLSDMQDYPYYMIMAAVARTLELAVKRKPKPLRIRKRDYFHLNLPLNWA